MKLYKQLKRLYEVYGIRYSINKLRFGKNSTVINLLLNMNQYLLIVEKDISILRELLLQHNIDINIVFYQEYIENNEHIDILDTRQIYMTGESVSVCPIITIGKRLNKIYNTHIFDKNTWYLNVLYINSLDFENHKIHYYASEVEKYKNYIKEHNDEFIPKSNKVIAKFINNVKSIRGEYINTNYTLDYDTLYDDSDVRIIK